MLSCCCRHMNSNNQVRGHSTIYTQDQLSSLWSPFSVLILQFMCFVCFQLVVSILLFLLWLYKGIPNFFFFSIRLVFSVIIRCHFIRHSFVHLRLIYIEVLSLLCLSVCATCSFLFFFVPLVAFLLSTFGVANALVYWLLHPFFARVFILFIRTSMREPTREEISSSWNLSKRW